MTSYIIHISDLHIAISADWTNMRECLLSQLCAEMSSVEEGHKLLVITGDYHNYDEKDFFKAEKFIKEMVEKIGLDIEKDVFLIPGNHDISLSEDKMEKAKQAGIINSIILDNRNIENEQNRFLLLQNFIKYKAMCQSLGLYKNSNDEPAGVHVRKWRDKLNLLHINTAIAADGEKKRKRTQLVDTYTLASDAIRKELSNGKPTIALGHNNFYDIHKSQRDQITGTFSQMGVRAYLCGDRHRFSQNRDDKTIALTGRYNNKHIPNIGCAKSAADSKDNYSEFGFFIHEWNEDTGDVNLIRYFWEKKDQDTLRKEPEAAVYNLSVEKTKGSEHDDKKTQSIDPLDFNKKRLIHDVKHRSSDLCKEDGMMRCMWILFEKHAYANEFSTFEINVLSMIQDEYIKIYDQYYISKKVDSNNLDSIDRILSDPDVVELENDNHVHPWIAAYLHFIRAERSYFAENYEDAIQKYSEAYNKMKNGSYKDSLSDIDTDEQICAYLQNSIGWSYYSQKTEESKRLALETYQKLFDEYKDIDNYFFSWRYRRNYGVCLENKKEYIKALEQYEKAIAGMAKMPENYEYKLYLTTCSAIMKLWDEETGKTTGQWIRNTRKIFAGKDEYFNADAFYKIEAFLELAEKKHRNKDNPTMTTDYCNQLSKMHTYKLILASDQFDRQKDIEIIETKLKELESIAPHALGWRYIKRDFYYAMYEVLRTHEDRDTFLEKAWEENEYLDGSGDAKDFGIMLSKKRQNRKKDQKVKQIPSKLSSPKEDKK